MTAIIAMNNSGAKLLMSDPNIISIVSDTLSYDVEVRSKRGPVSNRKETMLRFPDLLFEAGFVPMVKAALMEKGIDVSIRDLRDEIKVEPLNLDLIGITPYNFQEEAVHTFVHEKRGIVKVATGGGKTEIAIMATKYLNLPGTLFLTHKLDLVRQTRKRYKKRTGKSVGMISEGEWLPSETTVATVQTIMAHYTKIWRVTGKKAVADKEASKKLFAKMKKEAKLAGVAAPKRKHCLEFVRDTQGQIIFDEETIHARGMTEIIARKSAANTHGMAIIDTIEMIEDRSLKVIEFLSRVQFLIVDEAHRSSGESFYNIISMCHNALYRLSITATPMMKDTRHDDLRLIGASGNIIYEVTNEYLIKRGILAEPHFEVWEVPAFALPDGRMPSKRTKWPEIYKAGIVDNELRNHMVVTGVRQLMSEKRKTVVLIKEIKHGKTIQAILESQPDIRSRLVYGEDNADYREQSLRDLADGKLDVLVASTILDEGLDEPCISGLVLVGGGKSRISLWQRVGRAVRKKFGMDLDNFGNTAKIIYLIDTGDHRLLAHSSILFKAIKLEKGWVLDKIVMWKDSILNMNRAA